MVNKILRARNELGVTVNTVTILNLYGRARRSFIKYIIYGGG